MKKRILILWVDYNGKDAGRRAANLPDNDYYIMIGMTFLDNKIAMFFERLTVPETWLEVQLKGIL